MSLLAIYTNMKINEITEAEIDRLVSRISDVAKREIQRFASEKRDDMLLQEIRLSGESDEERLRAYFERTALDPTDLGDGVIQFHRENMFLAEKLSISASSLDTLLKEMVLNHEIFLEMIDGRPTTIFFQFTKADAK